LAETGVILPDVAARAAHFFNQPCLRVRGARRLRLIAARPTAWVETVLGSLAF
jgi:hypothetical protein